MRTRQTAQGFDVADGYDGFGARQTPFPHPSPTDRDAAYAFRGQHEPVRVHPHHPHHPHPQPHPFGGMEREFGVVPPPFGPDAAWFIANGYRSGGPPRGRRERDWGPIGRYPGFSENGYGEARGADGQNGEPSRGHMQDGSADPNGGAVYRPHRGPHFGKGPKGYQRADDRIRDEICERLARDGYIDASGVEVAVAGGVVRLFGTVREPEDRHAVERIILDVYGVQEIRSELRLERSESQQNGNSHEGGDQGSRR